MHFVITRTCVEMGIRQHHHLWLYKLTDGPCIVIAAADVKLITNVFILCSVNHQHRETTKPPHSGSHRHQIVISDKVWNQV